MALQAGIPTSFGAALALRPAASTATSGVNRVAASLRQTPLRPRRLSSVGNPIGRVPARSALSDGGQHGDGAKDGTSSGVSLAGNIHLRGHRSTRRGPSPLRAVSPPGTEAGSGLDA